MKIDKKLFVLSVSCLLVFAALFYWFSSSTNVQKEPYPIVNVKMSAEHLIGIWQDYSSLGDGWSNTYQFFDDGTFNFKASSYNCTNRQPVFSGTWKEDELNWQLTLTKLSATNLVGGTMQDIEGAYCLSEGVKKVATVLKEPETITINLSYCTTLDPDIRYPCLIFNNQEFYKFSTDPTYEGDGDLPPHPEFK